MPKSFLALYVVVFSLSAFSGGQFIVKYKEGGTPYSQSALRSQGLLLGGDEVSKRERLYTVKVPHLLRPSAVREQLEILRSMPEVEYAMIDHIVTMREDAVSSFFADDEYLSALWNLQVTGQSNRGTGNVFPAWTDFGTGGKDVYGNDIVVAIIDIGFDLVHEDLKGNFFVNRGEIPKNGQDDDGNGRIDDYIGWSTDNGPIAARSHGTHLAGIIGAKGGNGIGVVGINWNVKILPIQVRVMPQNATLASEVAKAYAYVMDMKEKWLETDGREGANIVVSNSSFGLDGFHCDDEDYSIWNQFYEAMGALGILSTLATANGGQDVDIEGDIPTTCTSGYIIAVSNVARDGTLWKEASWGAESVDLTAPGTGIFSTVVDSQYSFRTGTSYSAPHVAGAVAYLYSAASKSFIQFSYQHPDVAAIEVRRILLENTLRLSDLTGKVATGGTLNLYASAQSIRQY